MGILPNRPAQPMIDQLPALVPKIEKPLIVIVEKVKEHQKPKEQLYTIKQGDTLTSIAKAHQTSVERLWAKNSGLTDPNKIEPEKPLKIPQADEVLADRPLPAIEAPITIEEQKLDIQTSAPVTGRSSVSNPKQNTSGNTYSPGYCTWGVKNWRPDIPNGLGNADQWYYNYEGAKGSSPRAGAVGVAKAYMHVVLVLSVNGSNVHIREMNYRGLYVVSERVAPASEFLYIY